MIYDLKMVVDGVEILEHQDISILQSEVGPSITNVVLVNSACADPMELGAATSDQLTFTIINPHKSSFDGSVIEFYIRDTETDGMSTTAKIEEDVADAVTSDLIMVVSDSSEEYSEDEEPITVDEEADAEAVEEELAAGLDFSLEGELEEKTTETLDPGTYTPEWEQVGVYYMHSQNNNSDGSITLVCYDGFSRMGDTFIPENETATISDMYDDLTAQVLQKYGIVIDEEDFDDIADTEITIDFTCSFREAMGFFAGLKGGFATFGQDGSCGISQYTFDDNNLIDTDLIAYSETSAGEMIVEAILCNKSRNALAKEIIESGSGGQEIAFTNPFISQDILNRIYNTYSGMRYSGAKAVVRWDKSMNAGEFIRIFTKEEYENYLKVSNNLDQNAGTMTEQEIQELRDGMNRLGRIILISTQTIDFRGDSTSIITSICKSESTKTNKITTAADAKWIQLYEDNVNVENSARDSFETIGTALEVIDDGIVTIQDDINTLQGSLSQELVASGYAIITADPSLRLGKTTSPWKVEITNTEIALLNDSGATARFLPHGSGTMMRADVARMQTIMFKSTQNDGILGIEARTNGHISFKGVG